MPARIHLQQLRFPFGISRNTVTELPTVLFERDGGLGEGSPVRYLGQKAEVIAAELAAMEAGTLGVAEACSAARCAWDIAAWHARASAAGQSVPQAIAAVLPRHPDPHAAPRFTSYTIALNDLDTMEARAREAAHMPALKIKLGRDPAHDVEAVRRIRRAAPGAILRVDMNAGYSLASARATIPALADLGVKYAEQPLAIGALEDTAALRRESPIPIYADEDVQDMATLPGLRGRVDGINIKLAKCGGLTEAVRMIAYARAEGWKVLLGCMIETRLALGATACLASAVDSVDLDAHLLTTNDPFPPGSVFPPEAGVVGWAV